MSYSKVRYNRTLGGENAEVIVGKAIAYTTQPNYTAFEANAADGEIGLFDYLTGRILIAGGGAVPTPAAGTTVASQTGGSLPASTTYYFKLAYLNTSGESVASTEFSQATAAGTATNSILLTFAPGPYGTTTKVFFGTTAGGEAAYFSAGSGETYNFTIATGGTTGTPLTTATGTMANVLAKDQAFFIAQRRDTDSITGAKYVKKTITVKYDATRTRKVPYIAPVKQVTTISVVTGYVPATGDDIEIAIIETTPGNEPYPVWDYDAVIGDTGTLAVGGPSVPVLTMAQALQKIVYRINNPLDLVHKDDGQPCTATYTDNGGGAYTVVITANYFEENFRIALRGPLATYAAVNYTTGFVAGSGYSDDVNRLEQQGWIFEGVTTNYPMIGVPQEYGAPTPYTVSGLTYNIYHLDPMNQSKEPNPHNIRTHFAHIYLIPPVAVGGASTSPDAIISAILGF